MVFNMSAAAAPAFCAFTAFATRAHVPRFETAIWPPSATTPAFV